MKFEVNRLAMLEAAKCAARVAPSSVSVAMLNNILIECNDDTGEVFLTATNYEVSIQLKIIASVEESGTMLITPQMLTGMMSKMDGEFISFSADCPNFLTAEHGRSRFRLKCMPHKGYPKPTMPFPEESVTMSGICSLAKRTTFLVSNDDKKPALQCVNIKLKNNAVHAAASDGVRMMLTKDSTEPTDEQEFLIPGRALSMLASISNDTDVFEVSEIKNQVVFVRGDMIFTVSKLACGEYMDTTSLIKNFKPAYSALVEVGNMKEALNILYISATAGGTFHPINLVLSDGEVFMRCDGDYSEGSASVSANISANTPESGFYYDVAALLKLFQVLVGRVKLEITPEGYMFVKSRSEVYLQSPVRAPAKKVKPAKDEKARAKGAEVMKVNQEAA